MSTNPSQKEVYESIMMIHPDGTPMCRMGRKKALWYINKNLATWIDKNSFKLKFAPTGHGNAGNSFYMQEMKNQCVCCGIDQKEAGLNKHHVVPYVFRSRFPLEYKESNHHDIVAICIDCHEHYEKFASELKNTIASKYGLCFDRKLSPEEKQNRRIKMAARLLEKIKNNKLVNDKGEVQQIPENKIKDIEALATTPLYPIDTSEQEHNADKIIRNVLQENSLDEFIKLWRAHFINIMKPKYLPLHWSVDTDLEKRTKKRNL